MDESLKFKNKPMKAGFPNASEDAVFSRLNLHELLVKRPSSTYFMRLEGSLGFGRGDLARTLLVVDKGARMTSGDILVVSIRGEFGLKRYRKVRGRNWLVSVKGRERPIEMIGEDSQEVSVWGVVLHIIESVRGI